MTSAERFPIFHNVKWGYIDRNANIVIEPQFDDTGRFSDGLANVRIEDECGYIDPSGKIVIGLQFEAAFDFTEGLAAVYVVNRSLFQTESTFQPDLDKGVIPSGLRQQFEYTGIALPQNTLVEVVERGSEWTITDPLNEHTYFVEKDDDALDVYIKGRTQAEKQLPDYKRLEKVGGEWGYIDKTGEFIIEPQFDNAAPFSEGLARVQIRKRWGYIDKAGQQVIPAIFNLTMLN